MKTCLQIIVEKIDEWRNTIRKFSPISYLKASEQYLTFNNSLIAKNVCLLSVVQWQFVDLQRYSNSELKKIKIKIIDTLEIINEKWYVEWRQSLESAIKSFLVLTAYGNYQIMLDNLENLNQEYVKQIAEAKMLIEKKILIKSCFEILLNFIEDLIVETENEHKLFSKITEEEKIVEEKKLDYSKIISESQFEKLSLKELICCYKFHTKEYNFWIKTKIKKFYKSWIKFDWNYFIDKRYWWKHIISWNSLKEKYDFLLDDIFR